MKKKIIMKLAALFLTGILAVKAACAGIGENTVYAAEADTVDSETDGADSEFTGASGTGWVLDSDGLLTITGDPDYKGFYPKWYNYCEKITKVEVGSFKSKSTKSWFDGCYNIESISFDDGFDTSSVTNMNSMFSGCSNLTSLDVSDWNTSKVTDMYNMFSGCSNLTSLDLSDWDTSNVKTMEAMFENCRSLTSLDLSGWDTSNVKNMEEMFENCRSLTSLDLSGWDTSNVTNMYYMFSVCRNLTSLDLSGWDTSNVTSMGGMFEGCSSLASLDLSDWKTSKVTYMGYMFSGCSGLTTLDLSGWNIPTSMYNMFSGCSSLTSLDVSGWDTSNVTYMNDMFSGLSNLTSLDVSGWDTSKLTDMNEMFSGCSSLASLDVSGWDTSKVTNMNEMFFGCSSLASLDVSGWDTSNVTSMDSMFWGCSNLTSLDVSGWDTSKVTDMDSIFSGCISIDRIKPFVGFNRDFELPLAEMYDINGTTYTSFPKGLTEPMTLYASVPTASSATSVTLKNKVLSIEKEKQYKLSYTYAPLYCTDEPVWTSSDSSVVSVNSVGMITSHSKEGTAVITVSLGSYSDSCEVTVKPPYAVAGGTGWILYSNGLLTISGDPEYEEFEVWESTYYCPEWVSYSDKITMVEVGAFKPKSTKAWFANCYKIKSISFDDGFDASNVTDMSEMFYHCQRLTSLDLSGFDTSNVTNMNDMFCECYELTSLNLSGFDTSKVTDMNEMFSCCYALTSLDLSGFNTTNVKDMSGMFHGCTHLTSLDLSDFDTSKVTSMLSMFSGCSSLTSLDLNSFDTSNVTDMEEMFRWCSGLTGLDVSGFNTSNVTDMVFMFSGCSGLTGLDVSGFNTSNVTSMSYMFYDCSGLTSLDLSDWNTSKVTYMSGMFENCSGLTSLDLNGFDTSSVTNMDDMFRGCSSLASLDVSGWDTSKVTGMAGMFSSCSSLASLDVSGWDTSKVTDMDSIFSDCSGLASLEVSGWDTSNVTSMNSMFSGCSSLASLEVSGWDTSKVTDMDSIFSDCISIDRIKPFVGFNRDLELPLAEMYDINGTTYTSFPQGLIEPMTLYASLPTASSATSVTLKKKVLSIEKEKQYKLSYTYAPLDCTDEPVWTSSDSSVVSVNSVGVITSHSKEGTAVITVSLGSYSDSCEVTVMPFLAVGTGWTLDSDGILTISGDPEYGEYQGVYEEEYEGEYSNSIFPEWYNYREKITKVEVGAFKPKSTKSWFEGCKKIESISFDDGFDTSNVTEMESMFRGCSGLTSLDVSGFNTSNVTDMGYMFSGCSSLASLDVSGFNTSNVTDIGCMFSGCSSLASLEVSGWDTSNVTYMYGMFNECSSLTSLDVSGWDTSNVTSMNCMFMDCSGLTSLDVSSWNTSNVKYMNYMFLNCSSLTSLDVSSFDTSSIANTGYDHGYNDIDIFDGCKNIERIKPFVGFNLELELPLAKMYDIKGTEYTTFPKGLTEPMTLYASVPTASSSTPTPTPTATVSDPSASENNADISTVTPTPTPTSTVSDPSASENNADIPTVTPTPTAIPTTIPEFDNGDTISTKSISGLPKGAQTLDAGGSVNLKPVVKTADGANVSPAWLAPVGHVLDAVPQADGSLEIKAVGPGTAYVTVVSGTKTKTVKYNVKQAVKRVDTSVNAINLGISEKYRLCVIPDVPTTDKFYFESSDKSICSVDQKGLIKAKKTEGSATITIYAYDKKSDKKNRPVASVDVKVESKEATEVSVTDASINYLGNKELYVGEMGYISTLINGGANNGGAAVKYTMDNKGIVKIDSYGHVTAKKAGTVTITATCGEKTDSIMLTVKQPLKLYKVNKSYVKVAATKAGKSSKKVTFTVKTNPTAKKFTDGGGRVTWTVTSKDTGISLKSDDGKGKAVFEVPSGASDTIVTATISDPVTGKTYSTDCMIDVK